MSQRLVRYRLQPPPDTKGPASRGFFVSAEEGGKIQNPVLSTRVRERVMRRFKSTSQAQRFLGTHASVYKLFNLGRYLISANHYRDLRICAFSEWRSAVS